MGDIHDSELKRLHNSLGHLVYEMTRVQFSTLAVQRAWRPAINVYRCQNCLAICAELAGVDKSTIDLRVEPRRLVLRGHREAPEPSRKDTSKPGEILAMEIDFGAFERELVLPVDIETDRVTAEQKNGLLWIYLPFRAAA